jgi:hypothetical protein
MINGTATIEAQTIGNVKGVPMRSEAHSRNEFPVFTLTCPGNDSTDERVHDIQLRGNLPLMIGGDVLAEITHADLIESWETAISLPLKDLNAMTTLAGKRLSEMLEENLDAEDLTELVSDAAVLFLLAMRRFGVSEANRIPACTVKWNGQEATESVQMLA